VPAQPLPQPAEHRVGLLGAFGGLAGVGGGHGGEHRRPDVGEVRVVAHDLRGDALALPDQAEQDVLGADVVVLDRDRLAQRQFQGLLRPRRERDVPAWRGLAPADSLDHLLADAVAGKAEAREDLAAD
jgi:hypothetical protein